MTPEQKTALEAIVGRELTPVEIAAIEPFLPNRNDVAIARILSENRTTVVPHEVGVGTILAVMYPTGGEFLDTLEALGQTDSNVKWAMELIKQGKLDVGVPMYRGILQQFAGQVPSLADGIEALLATAEQPYLINYNAVSDALNIAEWRMTL